MLTIRDFFFEELNLYIKKLTGVVEDTDLQRLEREGSGKKIPGAGMKFLIDLRDTEPVHTVSDLRFLDNCLDTLQKKSDMGSLSAVYLTDTPQQMVFSTLIVERLNAIGLIKVGICSTLDAAVKSLGIDMLYLEMIRSLADSSATFLLSKSQLV